jgi:hypothetical protein
MANARTSISLVGMMRSILSRPTISAKELMVPAEDAGRPPVQRARARVYLRECCLGRFFSYFFPGVVLAAPDEAPIYLPTPADQTHADVAAQAGPKVCYVGGCYHLQGDGVTVAQQWVWVSNPPPLPPGLSGD